jgi:hypothetical protein
LACAALGGYATGLIPINWIRSARSSGARPGGPDPGGFAAERAGPRDARRRLIRRISQSSRSAVYLSAPRRRRRAVHCQPSPQSPPCRRLQARRTSKSLPGPADQRAGLPRGAQQKPTNRSTDRPARQRQFTTARPARLHPKAGAPSASSGASASPIERVRASRSASGQRRWRHVHDPRVRWGCHRPADARLIGLPGMARLTSKRSTMPPSTRLAGIRFSSWPGLFSARPRRRQPASPIPRR